MKVPEIGAHFSQEMAKFGKHMVQQQIEHRREICFFWSDPVTANTTMLARPWVSSHISRRSGGWTHDFCFWIKDVDYILDKGLTRGQLKLSALNWPAFPTGFGAEPVYIDKAAKITNEWIDKFVVAVGGARSELPWTSETEIMGKKLWMWLA